MQQIKHKRPTEGFDMHNHEHTQFLSMLMVNYLKYPEKWDAVWNEIKNLSPQQIDNVTTVYSWLKECWDAKLIPGLITIDKTKNGFLDNLPAIWELIINDVRGDNN